MGKKSANFILTYDIYSTFSNPKFTPVNFPPTSYLMTKELTNKFCEFCEGAVNEKS